MISGIYVIRNTINYKIYIGSACDLERRWFHHEWCLNNGKHDNKHLQNAWNKYGKDCFQFEIVEYCEKDNLIQREQFYLDLTECYKQDLGYNIRIIAESNLGLKHTEETKQNLSNFNKKRLSKKENHPFYGKHLTEEHKQKIREKNLGYEHSLETKQKMKENHYDCSGDKNPNYGKPRSEETKRKISESHKGKYVGILNPNYGNHLSETSKKRISDAQRGNKNRAKLTWEKVREIREKYKSENYTQKQIGEQYGISQQTISRILNYKIWK